MERASRVLTSTAFLSALALLVANDLVLKQAYPGMLTGKLSDFAGLFAFPMFWAALLPRRKREIYFATALAFVWWKSPFSQPAIETWNAAGFYQIARVVDGTDLVALVSVAASGWYVSRVGIGGVGGMRRATARVVLPVAALAFVATSGLPRRDVVHKLPENDPTTVYGLAFPPVELPARLDASGLFHGAPGTLFDQPGAYDISIDNDCREASVETAPLFDGTAIRLRSLRVEKRCNDDGEKALRKMFETEVLPRLTGAKPPFARTTEPKGERFDYPAGSAPAIEFNLSAAAMADRLDHAVGFDHEFHDGTYQLGAIACYGRFTVTEAPDQLHAVITGVGFTKPCFKDASLECLDELFRSFISFGIGTAVPVTPAASPTAGSLCPDPIDSFD